jgi:hypothetical protein
MSSDNKQTSDVLQSTKHQQLSAEEIAKALARHNRDHKGGAKEEPKPQAKKAGKH